MSLPIVFSPEARAEFDEAHDWYEKQRAGLGDTFNDWVHAVLKLIAEFPRMHAIVLGDVRKAVVPRFPYCCSTARKQVAFASSPSFTAAEIHPCGKSGLMKTENNS